MDAVDANPRAVVCPREGRRATMLTISTLGRWHVLPQYSTYSLTTFGQVGLVCKLVAVRIGYLVSGTSYWCSRCTGTAVRTVQDIQCAPPADSGPKKVEAELRARVLSSYVLVPGYSYTLLVCQV